MNETERNYFLVRIAQDMSTLAQAMLEVATKVLNANREEQEKLNSGEEVAHIEIAPAALMQWSYAVCGIQKNLLMVVTEQQEAVDIVAEADE